MHRIGEMTKRKICKRKRKIREGRKEQRIRNGESIIFFNRFCLASTFDLESSLGNCFPAYFYLTMSIYLRMHSINIKLKSAV